MKWRKDANGERWPEYTAAEAERICKAVWLVQHLLPHPDEALRPEDAEGLREFNRAIAGIEEKKA